MDMAFAVTVIGCGVKPGAPWVRHAWRQRLYVAGGVVKATQAPTWERALRLGSHRKPGVATQKDARCVVTHAASLLS